MEQDLKELVTSRNVGKSFYSHGVQIDFKFGFVPGL